MALITTGEIINLVLMCLALGFIFKDTFKKPMAEDYDPIKHFSSQKSQNFLYAIYVVAPAIIFHEFAHKFVALAMGFEAEFHASLTGLGIGIFLKLMNFGFLFFVPGFVVIKGFALPWQSALTAFAGPLANAALYIIAILLMKSKNTKRSWFPYLRLTKQINGFLFLFNLIPFPPFDGYQVFSGLIKTVSSFF